MKYLLHISSLSWMPGPSRVARHQKFLFYLSALLLVLVNRGLAKDVEREKVSVTVQEVTANNAYISSGTKQGIQVGQEVTINNKTYRIVEVSSTTALIKVDEQTMRAGDRGFALVEQIPSTESKAMVKPKELSFYRGKWPDPLFPSSQQQVDQVPLGTFDTDEQFDMTMMLQGAGLFDLKSDAPALGRSQLRARVHYEPIREWPLSLDADTAVQLWFGENLDERPSEKSRPLVRVRQLQGTFGEEQDLYAALGRLRYASLSLGMLDGVKAQTPLIGDLKISAFGGVLPDPLNGTPSTDAARFGTELSWDAEQLSWRPLIALSAHGSIFDGELDERRLNGLVDLFPSFGHMGAHFELALFDDDNPWQASTLEINSAGAEASVYIGDFVVGGRAQMQRPERSLWLLSHFPIEWMCITQRSASAAYEEICSGDDMSYLYALDAGMTLDRFFFDISGLVSEHAYVDSSQIGSQFHMRILPFIGRSRFDLSLMASTGSLLQTGALTLGVGTPLLDDLLDVSLRYRPSLSTFEADIEWYWEHTVGTTILVQFLQDLELSLDADLVTGRDVDLLLVQTTLIWRI